MSDYEGRRRRIQPALLQRVRGLATLPTLASGLVVIVILVVAVKMIYWPAGSNGALPEMPIVPGGPTDPVPSESLGDVATPSASRAPQVTRYEAETALISQGKVDTNHTGYSGTGFVDYTNTAGGYIQFTVQATRAGSMLVRLRYANGSAAGRPMNIVVNGVVAIRGMAFDSTTAWTNWRVRTFRLNLNAGPNVVRAVAASANGGPNVDYLEIEQ